jgi:uncharacterized protein with NRDE domain
MCLVFISFQTHGADRLMIGANREESFDRPTTSPVCARQSPLRCLLAGADHGPDGTFPEMGTWLGINEQNMAVAVTNRRDGVLPPEEQVRSRGLLAVALLGRGEPGPAAEFAASQLARGRYGGCNFLVANSRKALVVQAPGADRVSVVELKRGTHAMTNLDLDDKTDPRIQLVQASLQPDDFISSGKCICRDDEIVISGDKRGTVSSSLILAGGEIVLYHVRGDPRRDDYREYRLIPSVDSRQARVGGVSFDLLLQ